MKCYVINSYTYYYTKSKTDFNFAPKDNTVPLLPIKLIIG